MNENHETLECLSILVCDDIYRDEVTRKLVIVGTFNTIHSRKFPYRHDHISVLITLTSGRRTYDVELGIEHGETGSTIASLRGPMHVNNPLLITDINVQFHGLEFPVPGKYWVTLKVDGMIVSQRPFHVLAIPQPPPGGPPQPPPPPSAEAGPPFGRGFGIVEGFGPNPGDILQNPTVTPIQGPEGFPPIPPSSPTTTPPPLSIPPTDPTPDDPDQPEPQTPENHTERNEGLDHNSVIDWTEIDSDTHGAADDDDCDAAGPDRR